MADLIDRQAAIDVIDSYEVNAPDYMQGWAVKLIEAIKGDIRGLISELPSAQPEIVHCKECKHAPKCYGDVLMRSRGGGYIYCPVEYCSRAERRRNERSN